VTWPANPLDPKSALPPWLRAGDAHAWSVQTRLPLGASIFFVLTGVISNVPTRITIGGAGVAVGATGVAAFTLASTDTLNYAPGRYQWVCFGVDADAQRFELAQGQIRIEPNPAGTSPVDPRTYNERLLGSIRKLLEGAALDDAVMYKIGNRELTKMPRLDLMKWEAIVEGRVKRARRRRGEKVRSDTIGITFGGR